MTFRQPREPAGDGSVDESLTVVLIGRIDVAALEPAEK